MTASQPEEKSDVTNGSRQRAGARQGQTLIEVRDLRTYFYMDEGVLFASLQIQEAFVKGSLMTVSHRIAGAITSPAATAYSTDRIRKSGGAACMMVFVA